MIASMGHAHANVDVDQYGGGQGFGFVYESSEPKGAHLIGTIHTRKWLNLVKPMAITPGAEPVTQWPLLRGVIWWLNDWIAHEIVHPDTHAVPAIWMGDLKDLSSGPPGHGEGDESWVFRSLTWNYVTMPLYHSPVVLSLCEGVPRTDPWDQRLLLLEWGLFIRKFMNELPKTP